MQTLFLKKAIDNDGTGMARPDAVWKPIGIMEDIAGSAGSISMLPYNSAADVIAGEGPIANCQHNIQLSPLYFLVCSLLAQGAGNFSAHTSDALVRMALIVPDTDTGQKDANGQPIMAPYFADAVPVLIDVPNPPGLPQLLAAASAIAAASQPVAIMEAASGG